MKLNILYFGMVAEAIHCTTEELILKSEINVHQLNKQLEEKYIALGNLDYQIAVNKELVSRKTIINTDCEIALLPPFAGG